MSEHEQRTEDEVLGEQAADAVEDLDVPEGQSDEVSGGAFPKKWEEPAE